MFSGKITSFKSSSKCRDALVEPEGDSSVSESTIDVSLAGDASSPSAFVVSVVVVVGTTLVFAI